MDNIVRSLADCVDRRFHRVPRSGWVDSPFACVGSDFPDIAFRHGCTDGIIDTRSFSGTYSVQVLTML